VLSAVSGAALLAGVAYAKLRRQAAEALGELRATGPAGALAATGLTKVAGAAGKAGAAFVALEIGDQVLQQFMSAAPDVDRLAASLQNLASTGQVSGELQRVFGDMHNIGTEARMLSNNDPIGKFLRSMSGAVPLADHLAQALGGHSFQKSAQDFQALDSAISQVATSSGDAHDALAALQQIAKANGLTWDQITQLFPQTVAEINKLQSGASGVAGAVHQATAATKSYKTASQAAAAATRGERDAFVDLTEKLKAETDPVFGLIAAERTLTSAKHTATAAIKKYGQNSIQAKDATIKLAQAALDLQSKVGAAGSTLDGKMSPSLLKTLHAAGLTDTQIKILAGQFRGAKTDADKFAGNYAAHASAPGATKADQQIKDAYRSALKYAGKYDAKINVIGAAEANSRLEKLLIEQEALRAGTTIGFARHKFNALKFDVGGWTGPGPAHQPAGIVHADEFVIKKSSRQRIEAAQPGLLDRMNRTGQAPGYAAGGRVMWPFPVDVSKTKIPQLYAGLGSTFAGGGSLGAWIRAAIALTHVPASWAGPLHTLVMRESGGNPRAINLWDSNAKAGHPSKGLAQTIPSTFEHYRLHSLPDNIYNPVANLAAAIRYIEARYGSIFRVQQANSHLPPKGYAGGGLITEPIVGVGASGRRYTFGEYGAETVVPGVPQYLAPGSGGAAAGNTTIINLTVPLAAGANPREAGRQIAEQLKAYVASGGSVVVRGQKVLGT
jgi:hypothetical protein